MTEQDYRGGKITSYQILSHQCSYCEKMASMVVYRLNDFPPRGYIKGGTIATYYCTDHVPQVIIRDIKNWQEVIKLPMGED